MHGDLKLSNIAVTAGLDPFILDVECIVEVPEDGAERDCPADYRYTLEYAAPEVTERQKVSAGTDLYSFGVVMQRIMDSVPSLRLLCVAVLISCAFCLCFQDKTGSLQAQYGAWAQGLTAASIPARLAQFKSLLSGMAVKDTSPSSVASCAEGPTTYRHSAGPGANRSLGPTLAAAVEKPE